MLRTLLLLVQRCYEVRSWLSASWIEFSIQKWKVTLVYAVLLQKNSFKKSPFRLLYRRYRCDWVPRHWTDGVQVGPSSKPDSDFLRLFSSVQRVLQVHRDVPFTCSLIIRCWIFFSHSFGSLKHFLKLGGSATCWLSLNLVQRLIIMGCKLYIFEAWFDSF